MMEILTNWHPIFVQFTISFATAAIAFTIAGELFNKRPWASQFLLMGRWMRWAAALSACIAVVFGLFAFDSVAHNEAGQLAITIHRNWAIGAVGFLVFLAAFSVHSAKSAETPSYELLFWLLAVWLISAIAAWDGGEVVYRHGLGVMALTEDFNVQQTLHN